MTERSPGQSTTENSLVFDAPEPRGEILITAAPGCQEATLLRHVTGAIGPGNRVALLCLADLAESVRCALGEVESTAAPGTFREVHRDDWLLEWSLSHIVVLVIGDRAFVSDGSAVSSNYAPGPGLPLRHAPASETPVAALGFVQYLQRDLDKLYRTPRTITVTWECVPVSQWARAD